MPSGFSFLDRKHYFIYVSMLLFFVAAVALILWLGSTPAPRIDGSVTRSSLTSLLWQNFRTPLAVLLVQIVVILVAAGLFSRLFRRIGQPPVMGEMIAGIVLGPSV